MVEGIREVFQAFFIGALVLYHFPKAIAPNTITLDISISIYNSLFRVTDTIYQFEKHF